MHFSHVVVTPVDGDDGRRGIHYMWQGPKGDKLDWALLHACQSGHLTTVQTLVDRGAQVGVTDGRSQTALHVSAFEGHTDIVRLLLEQLSSDDAGGDAEDAISLINAEDACGHTALMLASLRGHLEIMRMLVEAGAHPSSGA